MHGHAFIVFVSGRPSFQALADRILVSDCLQQQHTCNRQLPSTKDLQTVRSRSDGQAGSRRFRSPLEQGYEA